MTQRHHVRTVEIRTITATCDACGERSPAAGIETLLGWGWALPDLPSNDDLCPECAAGVRDRRLRYEESRARAKHIAALEAGDPIYVRGRVYVERGTIWSREELNDEIEKALR